MTIASKSLEVLVKYIPLGVYFYKRFYAIALHDTRDEL